MVSPPIIFLFSAISMSLAPNSSPCSKLRETSAPSTDRPSKQTCPPWSLTLDQPTAYQLNDQLRALLDRHAPATQRKVPQRRSSPWYSAVASQLRALKQEKRRAERQWLRSGLTVHRQIFNALKHKITRLVDRAKTTFYSSKITVSTTRKELFSVTNRLMNKTKCTQIPSSVPISQLLQRFSDFFCQKISTIRQNIDSCSSTAPPGFDQFFFWKAAHPFQRCK